MSTPNPHPATFVIPEAMSDEDGEVYWLDGHIDRPLAVLAVVVSIMADVDAEAARNALLGWFSTPAEFRTHAADIIANTRHVWLVQDPANDDLMQLAEATTVGASPFTRVDI